MNSMNSMTDRMDSTMMPGMTKTSRKRPLLIALGLIALIGGWALFRPELLFIDKTVNESLPGGSAAASDSGAMTLAQGNFHSVAHETKGTATIHRLANGKRVVRLTDFETSNGPDVHVFAVAANDASDSETVKQSGYVDLGSLKGNVGDQNYDLPDNLDLSKYRAITIWCNRFNVNFGTAPLAVPGAATSQSADARPVSLASGMFHSVAHETKGSAAVYRLGEKRLLRLTDFETSNGPDVRVYLVAAPDASDSDTVKNAGFVELGKLKGNVGDQNYDIPGDVDLDKYRAVTVWCARFGVNFGTAPLK